MLYFSGINAQSDKPIKINEGATSDGDNEPRRGRGYADGYTPE